MYESLTNEEFDRILAEIVDGLSSEDLLLIPGVCEILTEHYNNEVIEQWEQENPTLAAWENDKDGEYVLINTDESVTFVAHGSSLEEIWTTECLNHEPDSDDYIEQEDAIRDWMHDHGYYPNVWRVNDHGNVTLLNSETFEEIGGIV